MGTESTLAYLFLYGNVKKAVIADLNASQKTR